MNKRVIMKRDLEDTVISGKDSSSSYFFSEKPMTSLCLPANVLNEDGSAIFNCVEVTRRNNDLILRIIVQHDNVTRGINLHVICDPREHEAKYRLLRVLIRNVGNIKITFPTFRVTYSGYKSNLCFSIRDFEIVDEVFWKIICTMEHNC